MRPSAGFWGRALYRRRRVVTEQRLEGARQMTPGAIGVADDLVVDVGHHDRRLGWQHRCAIGGEQAQDPDSGDTIAIVDGDPMIVDEMPRDALAPVLALIVEFLDGGAAGARLQA